MAITVNSANKGTATEKLSDTSISITPSSNFTVGRYAILVAVMDNSAGTGGSTTTLSVTDSVGGNTWIRDREETRTAGSALDGVTVGIFRCLIATAITTSDTITITNTANATAKGAGVGEVSVGAGNTLVVAGSNANNAGAATSYSVTTGSLSNLEHLYFGVSGAEEELGTAVTKDAAFTQTWFGGTIGSGTGGANATNCIAAGATLLETSTTQTYDNSGLTSCDRATLLVAYEEAAPVTSLLPKPSTMLQLIRR